MPIPFIPLLPPHGSAAKVAAYTGPASSVVINTDIFTVHVQDGQTPGGFPLSKVGHQHTFNELTSFLGFTPAQLGTDGKVLASQLPAQQAGTGSAINSINTYTSGDIVLTTNEISEGSNKYYTASRARSALSLSAGVSGASYDATTGVLDLSALSAPTTATASVLSNTTVLGTTAAAVSIKGIAGVAPMTVAAGASNALTIAGGASTPSVAGGDLQFQSSTGVNTILANRITVKGTTGAVQLNSGWSDNRNNPAFSATPTINCALGNSFVTTLTSNISAITFSNVPAAGNVFSLTFFFTQAGSGSYTVTWPASVKWGGGTAPVLTTTVGKTDIISITTHDGGVTWYGFPGGYSF